MCNHPVNLSILFQGIVLAIPHDSTAKTLVWEAIEKYMYVITIMCFIQIITIIWRISEIQLCEGNKTTPLTQQSKQNLTI